MSTAPADFPLTLSSKTLPPNLLGLVERLARTVAVARALAMAGRPLDLTGLDDGVGMLCAQTLDLPIEEARAMCPVLIGLRESIDQLTIIFTQKMGACDDQLPPA